MDHIRLKVKNAIWIPLLEAVSLTRQGRLDYMVLQLVLTCLYQDDNIAPHDVLEDLSKRSA